MGGAPADHTPGQDAPESAGAKIAAAFELLASAFEDTRLDSEVLGREDLLQQVAASQQVLNTAFAVQAARLAQAAAIEDVRFADHTAPCGFREHEVAHPIGTHQDEFIGCEIGPLLGWTSGQAVGRVSEAVDFITRTPRLFARVGTGEIEAAKLAAIHRAIGRTVRGFDEDGGPVAIDLARAVETALLGGIDPEDDTVEAAAVVQDNVEVIAAQSTRRVQHRVERILRTLDPVSAGKAAARRRRDRVGVFCHPDEEPGLTHLHAILDSVVAAKLMAAVDQLARDLHADTTTDKTLAECRADALADLVLGNANVTTKLVLQVPVHVDTDGTSSGSDTTAGRDSNGHTGHDTTARGSDTGGTGAGRGQGSAFWPAAFAHPITGLTVLSHRHPTATADDAGAGSTRTGTGLRVKTQQESDAEFNDLMKSLWPPDPDDYPPEEFDEYYEPAHRHEPDDGPPAWYRPQPPAASNPPGQPKQPRASIAWLGDGVVPGVGVIPAAVIQEMCRSFGTVITRALVNADTGVTVETCETQYRPSQRLADFIRARDVHCRFPNCDRLAKWCDIDHVTPWPGGPTAAWDLQLVCRHHHRTKQEQHWSVTMTAGGVCTWTSPSGRTYTTYPGE